ncbi:hypothetical protein GCM10023321_80040 [Pseudonocardia eucalypti]|uniref:Methyltransferase domain-containing protein n=1 Tax=Pseudonocardia eucalypti TaxID=648755 RepID=A0ABP9RCF8_9PSEU|nr:demethylmenaquinone methyltransferase/2-methoxy-6-polyprenyl-1,4-benzoquinol methylase [Pseudonocardia eucalypti]
MIDRNRLKFFFGGPVLEAVNPFLPGRPHARLLDMIDQRPAGRALELCAGTGYVARRLATRQPSADCYALDISPEMLNAGQRRAAERGVANLHFLHRSADDLPFDDASLNTVFAAFGLHELPTAVRERAVAESARALVSGGRILVMDLDRPAGAMGLAVDAYRAAMEPAHAAGVFGPGIARLLEANGLVIDAHQPGTPWTPIQYIAASKRS